MNIYPLSLCLSLLSLSSLTLSLTHLLTHSPPHTLSLSLNMCHSLNTPIPLSYSISLLPYPFAFLSLKKTTVFRHLISEMSMLIIKQEK